MTGAPATVLIAPDSFKGSITASDAAASLAAGLRSVAPDLRIDEVPMADGGEGTVEVALSAGMSAVAVRVPGPFGDDVDATYASDGTIAVIELAQAAGLHDSPRTPDAARTAGTYGVGVLIAHALQAGAQEIVLTLGGSATTDGGAGMLAALGAVVHGTSGPGGAALSQLSSVDLQGLDPRLAGARLTLASDVNNPLLGPTGAAEVFGPQKGADPDAVQDLERGLARWVQALQDAGVDAQHLAEHPGAGAAGGAGFGALVLGARQRPGIDMVLDITGFEDRVRGADLVITGEGSLDSQSLQGKTPVGVSRAARAAGAEVIAVAGIASLSSDEATAAGFSRVYTLVDLEPDPAASRENAGNLLQRTGAIIARDLGLAADTV